jgi:hypothetical protein
VLSDQLRFAQIATKIATKLGQVASVAVVGQVLNAHRVLASWRDDHLVAVVLAAASAASPLLGAGLSALGGYLRR